MTITQLIIDVLRDPEVRSALREAIGSTADEWIPVARAAELLGISPRVILDDARRGRIELGGAGRRRMVRRSELDRWLASRCTTPATTTDPRAEARAAVQRAAARVRGRAS